MLELRAAGVAIPVGYWLTVEIVAVEPIRRVAVHVFPRAARFGNGDQTTAATRLLVPVLVKRLLRSVTAIHNRRHPSAAAPFAREVPRIDLLEGPCLRVWAFFVDFVTLCGCSIGRERHATEPSALTKMIGARLACRDLGSRYRSAR